MVQPFLTDSLSGAENKSKKIRILSPLCQLLSVHRPPLGQNHLLSHLAQWLLHPSAASSCDKWTGGRGEGQGKENKALWGSRVTSHIPINLLKEEGGVKGWHARWLSKCSTQRSEQISAQKYMLPLSSQNIHSLPITHENNEHTQLISLIPKSSKYLEWVSL